MASRILKVESSQTGPLIRLVSTDSLDLHHTPYVVLTHCWGLHPIECKTMVDKVKGYYENISVNLLPKTFREAVEITLALEIQYIWIDSLCIVQDDEKDWQQESTKMASIWRGATLTLSASSAENSTQGCDISDLLAPAIRFSTVPMIPGQKEAFFALRPGSINHIYHPSRKTLSNAPVRSRAWIFQEEILSRRILHATNSQFVWQCATIIESEDAIVHTDDTVVDAGGYWTLPTSYASGFMFDKKLRFFQIEKRWWKWVDDYSERNLKFDTDQYAAFVGVTQLHAEFTGDEPVLGMWKKNLHIHLGWFVGSGKRPWKSLEKLRQPTWTWMSFPHGSAVPLNITNIRSEEMEKYASRQPFEMSYEAKVMGVEVEWTGRPLVSAPCLGLIHIHGWLDHMELPWARGEGNTWLDPDFRNRGFPLPREFYGSFNLFALYAYEKESTLWNQPPSLYVIYLVLEKIAENKSEYRRIGVAERVLRLYPGVTVESCLTGTLQTITLV